VFDGERVHSGSKAARIQIMVSGVRIRIIYRLDQGFAN
jgi:hypothetical protein